MFKIVNNLRNVGFAETDEILVIEAVRSYAACTTYGGWVYHQLWVLPHLGFKKLKKGIGAVNNIFTT